MVGLIKIVGISGLLLAMCGCAGTEPPPSAPRTITKTAGELSVVPQDVIDASGVDQFEVDGLNVIFKKTAGRSVVSAMVFIDGGAAVLNPETAGLESLALTVAVEGGTAKHDRDAFKGKLNAMGSSIGGSTNRDYSVVSMRTIRQYFGSTWQLLCEVLTSPTFDEKQYALNHKRALVAIKGETEDPENHMSLTASDLFFAGHPYQMRTAGTLETVGSFTRKQVMDHFNSLLTRERLTIVIVGDLEREDIERGIVDGLGSISKGSYRRKDLDRISAGAADLKVNEKDIDTNYMLGYFTAPSATEADYYPMLMALNLLKGRLFEEVRTKRNLTYAVSSGLGTRPYNYGYLYATPRDPNTTLEVIYDEVAKLQEEPVEASDLNDQIEVFLTRHYMGQETNAAQAASLGKAELVGGGWEQSLVFIDRIKAVTSDDIQRVAKGYIKNLHWGVVGSTDAVDPAIFKSR